MTLKNYLIVASRNDAAGMNIVSQLSQFKQAYNTDENPENFEIYLVEDSILHNENLDMAKINSYNFVIFASKHQSEKSQKTLSVHTPGNWRSAEYGGQRGKVSMTSALLFKQLFEKLNNNAKKFDLRRYDITLEATHHGPLIEKPCLFIEIGSTELEWRDKKAGFVVARAISDTLKDFKINPYNEIAIAIGGPHYCPSFNKIQANSNIAISHIIPQYSAPITEEMIQEAIKKTAEEVDFAVLDWDGLGTSDKRKMVLDALEKLYVRYKKSSEINKG